MPKYNIGFIALGNSIDLISENIKGNIRVGGVSTYQNILAKYIINNYASKFYVKILNVNPNNKKLKILKNERYTVIIAKSKKFKHAIIDTPHTHFVKPFHNAFLSAKFLKDVDIFHFNNFADAGLVKSINQDAHLIYTIHGRLMPRNALYYLSIYYKIVDIFNLVKMKNAIKHADALITVNSIMDKELYKFANKFNKKIFLIPNGVDTNKFNPRISGKSIREKYNIPEDAIVIISTSRFAYQRRIELLIKAFAAINKKLDNIYLMLVGYGPRKKELITLVRDLNIHKNVIFTGPIPNWELHPYYAAANIGFNSFTDAPAVDEVIHPSSLKEAIEKVYTISAEFSTIEALSSGLPVIAVVEKVAGYKNINYRSLKEDCGILIPRNDLDALIQTLKKIITDQSLRDEMSSNARRIAIEKRNLHSTMEKTIKVYEYALSVN